MKDFFKQFFYFLDKDAKSKIPFLFFSFFISALLDIIGIGLIGGFLALITNSKKALHHTFFFQGYLSDLSEQKLIFLISIAVVTAFIFKAIIALWIQKKTIIFSQALSVRLSARMLRAYQNAPYVFHLQNSFSYFLTRIGQINDYANAVLAPFISLILNIIVCFVILGFLLIQQFLPTLFLGVLFLLIVVLQDAFIKKHMISAGQTLAELSGGAAKAAQHALGGIKEIRILGREHYFLDRYVFFTKGIADARGTIAVLGSLARYFVENGIVLFVIGFTLISLGIYHSAASVVSTVGMFVVASARLLPTVTSIIAAINGLRSAYPSMKLVYKDLQELTFLEQNFCLQENVKERKQLPFLFDICLKEVSFSYPNSKFQAIDAVSMQIKRGQSVGLVGPSGAGKSTVVSIILGLLTPHSGKILIDGEPIVDLRAWLNHIAYIPQSIFLLDDTLKRNIAMGVEDELIDDRRLRDVIKMAQLAEVVEQLPQGVDTMIGDNGVRLSGGQRQRVALARAFYHDRDVIVMDEATSSLDNETEGEVIKAIKELKGQKTLIVIAHRLSTVEHCDVLYRFEKGCITNVGSYEQVVGMVN